MKKIFKLELMLDPISDLQKLMKKTGRAWIIIGGVAASVLGKPRFTADIDAVTVVEDKDVSSLLEAAEQFGFEARIKDPIAFAKKNRILLLRHKKSSINLDLSLGLLPFEIEAIKRSKEYHVGRVTFYLPKVEDLIVFKAVAHRPQDIMDIHAIVDNNHRINVKYIRKMVKEFACILEMPEIWTDIKSIITKQ